MGLLICPDAAMPTSPFTWQRWQWIVFSLISLGILFIPVPTGASTPMQRTFRIEAKRFEYNPAVLKVSPGDQVTFELVATDVVHGLSVDGYDVETTVEPGQVARITFVANREGIFRFHCTVTCGNLHPFMTGKLQVGANTNLLRSVLLIGLALSVSVWKVRK
jgi:heme/copper-type cytochrome/quinol oxidase subunit 2